ncbi:MAG: hypothetical protein AAFY71_03535 [Bacteroidota bacterium]
MIQSIAEPYLAYLKTNGHRPTTVFQFMQGLEKEETEFYESYNSFDALDKAVFQQFFDDIMASLSADETYTQYDAGQQLAAVYYTWFEKLKLERSLVKVMNKYDTGFFWDTNYTDGTEEQFKATVKNILDDGIDNGQVADRWFVNDWYPQLFWNQARYILHVWLHDNSKEFSRTDATIEKLVRFSFDLIQPNFIDSGWDFTQYIFKGK